MPLDKTLPNDSGPGREANFGIKPDTLYFFTGQGFNPKNKVFQARITIDESDRKNFQASGRAEYLVAGSTDLKATLSLEIQASKTFDSAGINAVLTVTIPGDPGKDDTVKTIELPEVEPDWLGDGRMRATWLSVALPGMGELGTFVIDGRRI